MNAEKIMEENKKDCVKYIKTVTSELLKITSKLSNRARKEIELAFKNLEAAKKLTDFSNRVYERTANWIAIESVLKVEVEDKENFKEFNETAMPALSKLIEVFATVENALDPENKTIDDYDVKEARLILGLSQSEFADALNVSKRTVEKWEQGERTVSQSTLKQIRVMIWFYANDKWDIYLSI